MSDDELNFLGARVRVWKGCESKRRQPLLFVSIVKSVFSPIFLFRLRAAFPAVRVNVVMGGR